MLDNLMMGYFLLGGAGCGLVGYAIRGWVENRKTNAKQLLLDDAAETIAELESFRKDNAAAAEEVLREANDAAKLANLKARFAALQ